MQNFYYSYQFVSRNKDNECVEFFEPRHRSGIICLHTTHPVPTWGEFIEVMSDPTTNLAKEFAQFTSDGEDGEVSRLYVNINCCTHAALNKALMKSLIDDEVANLRHIDSKLASLAATAPRATRRWLLDCDCSRDETHEVADELKQVSVPDVRIYRTLNNFAIVCGRGFDSRELIKRHPKVELKRDSAALLISHAMKR